MLKLSPTHISKGNIGKIDYVEIKKRVENYGKRR